MNKIYNEMIFTRKWGRGQTSTIRIELEEPLRVKDIVTNDEEKTFALRDEEKQEEFLQWFDENHPGRGWDIKGMSIGYDK
jgi:hypothetical protein